MARKQWHWKYMNTKLETVYGTIWLMSLKTFDFDDYAQLTFIA